MELLYESNQIVCVKGDKGDSENSLAKVFVQDPFNLTWFLEDSKKYVEVKHIVCILTSYKDHQDV